MIASQFLPGVVQKLTSLSQVSGFTLKACAFEAQARFASKKAGGAPRNKRKRTRPKDRGIHVFEGQFVQKNEILVKQHGTFTVYPGENVASSADKTLYSLEEGYVRLSAEDLRPFPDSPLHAGVEAGIKIRKQFVHVISPSQVGAFRLIRRV